MVVADVVTAVSRVVIRTSMRSKVVWLEVSVGEFTRLAVEVVSPPPLEMADTTVADTGPVESAPTFDEHIKPILEANCGNCHGTAGQWGASSYEDSQKAAYSAQCSGLTKGECYAVRIKDETMPTGGSVLSAMTDSGDLELLDQWIAAGMPEN